MVDHLTSGETGPDLDEDDDEDDDVGGRWECKFLCNGWDIFCC